MPFSLFYVCNNNLKCDGRASIFCSSPRPSVVDPSCCFDTSMLFHFVDLAKMASCCITHVCMVIVQGQRIPGIGRGAAAPP